MNEKKSVFKILTFCKANSYSFALKMKPHESPLKVKLHLMVQEVEIK